MFFDVRCLRALNVEFTQIHSFKYMLQSRESIYFIDHAEFITGQYKKILSTANKNEIKCFEFGSLKRALRPHWITIIAG